MNKGNVITEGQPAGSISVLLHRLVWSPAAAAWAQPGSEVGYYVTLQQPGSAGSGRLWFLPWRTGPLCKLWKRTGVNHLEVASLMEVLFMPYL